MASCPRICPIFARFYETFCYCIYSIKRKNNDLCKKKDVLRRPVAYMWRTRRGSNPQPLPSEGSTLSIELRARWDDDVFRAIADSENNAGSILPHLSGLVRSFGKEVCQNCSAYQIMPLRARGGFFAKYFLMPLRMAFAIFS